MTDQSVNVVIATCRRPERLALALTSISAASRPPGWTVGVTVVDDDPEGSARATAANFDNAFEDGLTYLECGSRNISQARNTGLESALKRCDWIGSIDDDVVVPASWFQTCAAALANPRHNAVTGPLLKDFSNGPSWLSSEPFDQIGILAGQEGEDAFVCATGNSWVSAAFLRDHPTVRFSIDLGETGGEDMDFYYRAVEQGLRPVYSYRAGVTETEPRDRCTLRYQVRRAFWLGVSEAQISLRLGLATRTRLVARAARRASTRGARLLPIGALPHRGVRFSLAIIAQCLGMTLGSAGFTLSHK